MSQNPAEYGDMHKHIHEQMRRDHGHLVAKPPRSPMNEFAKFIVNQSNFIFTCLGLIMMAIAFYSFFADFGEIDRGYFLGFGLCCFLFGLIVVCVAYLGGQGIYFQRKESAHTKWSGDRILGIYQIFLILCLAAELGWFAVSMNALVALRENADTVLADGLYNSPPEFSSMEIKFSDKFNAFFFAASSVCNTIKFEWFWSFVNKRCSKYDANMSQLSCQRCDDYSVTMCSADAKACYSAEQNNINYACPYAACREGILEFVLDQFTPLSYFAVFLIGFQIFLIILNCVLICHHRRDTEAEIRAKNGIFERKNTNGPSQPQSNGNQMPMQQLPPPQQQQQQQQQQQGQQHQQHHHHHRQLPGPGQGHPGQGQEQGQQRPSAGPGQNMAHPPQQQQHQQTRRASQAPSAEQAQNHMPPARPQYVKK